MVSFGKVLVTGGAGFIGNHLVDALVKEQYGVIVLDDLSSGAFENVKQYLANGVTFINGDVRDKQVVIEALKDVDAVFHFAAVTSVPYSVRNPSVTYDVNVLGTMNLLEACLHMDVKKFVFASSCALYGEAEYLPIDEKHPANPVSPYALSKLEAEKCCAKFFEMYGLKMSILRLFNVYGSRQRWNQYSGVITSFIQRLRQKRPPIIYGNGEQTRDFVHVNDVVQACMLVLGNEGLAGQTFNVGTGESTSVNWLARLLTQIFGHEGIVPLYKGCKVGDLRHSYADMNKAKEVLGYRAKTSLKEGLLTLVEMK